MGPHFSPQEFPGNFEIICECVWRGVSFLFPHTGSRNGLRLPALCGKYLTCWAIFVSPRLLPPRHVSFLHPRELECCTSRGNFIRHSSRIHPVISFRFRTNHWRQQTQNPSKSFIRPCPRAAHTHALTHHYLPKASLFLLIFMLKIHIKNILRRLERRLSS